jgi:hypothetical protein
MWIERALTTSIVILEGAWQPWRASEDDDSIHTSAANAKLLATIIDSIIQLILFNQFILAFLR